MVNKRISERINDLIEKIINHKISKIVGIVSFIYFILPLFEITIGWNIIELSFVSIAIIYGLPLIFNLLEEKFEKIKETISKTFEILKDIKNIKKIKSDIETMHKDIESYKNILLGIRSDIKDIEKELYGDKGKYESKIQSGIPRVFRRVLTVSSSLLDEQRGIKERIEDIEDKLKEIERKNMFNHGSTPFDYSNP